MIINMLDEAPLSLSSSASFSQMHWRCKQGLISRTRVVKIRDVGLTRIHVTQGVSLGADRCPLCPITVSHFYFQPRGTFRIPAPPWLPVARDENEISSS